MSALLRGTVVALTSALVFCLVGMPLPVAQAADEGKDDDRVLELVGKPAPELQADFPLNTKAVKLSDFKGKVVLLDFWAPWSNPCIATFPHLRDWQKDFQRDGLVVLGATRYYGLYDFDRDKGALKQIAKKVAKVGDSFRVEGGLKPEQEREMLKDFAEYHQLENPQLILAKEEWDRVRKAFHIRSVPTMVLIDRDGVVRMVRVGGSEKNAEDLLARIKKLTARN